MIKLSKKKIIFSVLLWGIVFSCLSVPNRNHATVVFYNVENLFDIIDDPHVNDNEFLPSSTKSWNFQRYHKKLEDIGNVLTNINKTDLPELIGLCEVENRTVLEDLVKIPTLAKGGYKIIHQDSPDARGIDVALLYRADEFRVVSQKAIPVNTGKTRDILLVCGMLNNEMVFVFVNHWPSRVGGQTKTETKRIIAAQTLKREVDNILKANPSAKIIVMGDMNDEPDNASLLLTLGANAPGSGTLLTNLMFPVKKQGLGSYFYNGSWNMLDNLIVTSSFLKGKGFTTKAPGKVFHEEWMVYTNKKGIATPNKTYSSSKYTGGVSDHFPVYFELTK